MENSCGRQDECLRLYIQNNVIFQLMTKYLITHPDIVEDFEDEFFWNVDLSIISVMKGFCIYPYT